MYGVIHLWRVRDDRREEHALLMRDTLAAQRGRSPEVLLNLTLGPAEDGTCAEVQVFADAAAQAAFPDRVKREDPELDRLWARFGPLSVPDSWRTLRFENTDFLPDSFVRGAAGLFPAAPSGRLAGRVAVVTGAARGNGRGIAREMARDGADVVLVDLGDPGEAAAEIEAMGRRALPVRADVSSEAAIRDVVERAVAEMGGLDIVVNNAGVFPFQPIERFTPDDFDRVMAVNVKAPWLFARFALPEMKRRGGGAIVNITSCSGHYGGASVGGSLYDTSKAGLRQMTCSLAAEFGPHNIRVNAIAPGVIVTEGMGGAGLPETDYGRKEIAQTPLRRLGYPSDVGTVAAFLASDDAAFVTGTTVILDGGAMAVW